MRGPNALYLASVIGAHKDRRVNGRVRLQKTMKLLQSLGFPSDYDFKIHFYGPYSEGVQTDIGLLELRGLIEETAEVVEGANPRYLIHLKSAASGLLPSIDPFVSAIRIMEDARSIVLELAATYQAYREQQSSHEKAVERVRLKKGEKCEFGNLENAIRLLRDLRLIRSTAKLPF